MVRERERERINSDFYYLFSTINFQCITINYRSDFIAEIRFSKVKYNGISFVCHDHFNLMEIVYGIFYQLLVVEPHF